MSIVILFFITKCVYESLKQVMAENDRFISVEVLPYDNMSIDRKQAKENLR